LKRRASEQEDDEEDKMYWLCSSTSALLVQLISCHKNASYTTNLCYCASTM